MTDNKQIAKQKANDIKHALRLRKMTLRSFAETYNYKYQAVSSVVRGQSQCSYGTCREILERLNALLNEDLQEV